VALQGLVGLSVKEVCRLTWDKVDLKQGTLIIDGHVKNKYRIRKLPIPQMVLALIKRIEAQRFKSNSVISHYSNYTSYTQALERESLRWNPSLELKPKDFRNTIQTVSMDEGWYDYNVKRYVGHAPDSVGERHYRGDKGKRLLPIFREKVLPHIEERINQWVPLEDSVLAKYIVQYRAEMHEKCTNSEKSKS
jgi:integrase